MWPNNLLTLHSLCVWLNITESQLENVLGFSGEPRVDTLLASFLLPFSCTHTSNYTWHYFASYTCSTQLPLYFAHTAFLNWTNFLSTLSESDIISSNPIWITLFLPTVVYLYLIGATVIICMTLSLLCCRSLGENSQQSELIVGQLIKKVT